MNSNTETVNAKFDTIKLAMAILVAALAVIGFYYFIDQSLWIRIVGLLVCAGIAISISMTTEKGRNTWSFFQEAQIEVRKVVWPTREETVQTTLLVILVVVVISIILWILDIFLGWSIQSLMGQGG